MKCNRASNVTLSSPTTALKATPSTSRSRFDCFLEIQRANPKEQPDSNTKYPNMEQELAELKKQVLTLQKELSRVSEEAEIRKTHHKYGYYLDKCLYNEVVDLFSNRPDTFVEFLGSRYLGKAGVERLYKKRFAQTFVAGRNGPIHGFLLDHIMMQDIVDVSASGDHAWCRMRALMQAGTHHSIEKDFPLGHRQWWEGGLYENEYVKEDGVWKLWRYRYFPFWHADFETGWSKTKPNYVPWPTRTFPEDPTGPDEILERKMLWPDTRVVPFHYPHPVTGERINSDDLRAPRYGEGVQEGCEEPLVLELPGGKQWERAEERESRKGEKVLPELVQDKAD